MEYHLAPIIQLPFSPQNDGQINDILFSTCPAVILRLHVTTNLIVGQKIFTYNCGSYCTVAVISTHHRSYFKICQNRSITTICFCSYANYDCGFDISNSTSKCFLKKIFRAYPRKFSPLKISSHTVHFYPSKTILLQL